MQGIGSKPGCGRLDVRRDAHPFARATLLGALMVAFLAGCSSSDEAAQELTSEPDASEPSSPTSPTPDASKEVDADVTDDAGAPASDASAPADVTAAQLVALTKGCDDKKSKAPYASDEGRTANIDICGLTGAVYWTADLDVDCDGKPSTKCNKKTDAAYQPETAATDSKGNPLDAASLPFVVVPLPSSRFDYKKSDLKLGSVVAVVYKDRLEYGIIGDLGPASIIGEASYAMAESLGINPNPSTGGVGSGVTYIAFTGAAANVSPREDHAEAVKVGKSLAKKLVADERRAPAK